MMRTQVGTPYNRGFREHLRTRYTADELAAAGIADNWHKKPENGMNRSPILTSR